MPITSSGTSAHRGARGKAGRRTASVSWSTGLLRLYRGSAGEGARFVLFAALLVITALCGGSSRPGAWQLLMLRPTTVLLATAILTLPGPLARPALRAPGLMLAALALVIVVQMVPLPPGIWTALPGHAPYAEAATAAGISQPWRPVTLSPDLTLNSLAALLVPAAVLLGAAALRPDQRAATAGWVIGIAVLSALLGLFQVTLGPSFYFYAPTDYGRPAGLFANINHQATMMAAAIPIAAGWATTYRDGALARAVVAAAAGVLLFAVVLVTGSRSGLLLAVLAVASVPLVVGNRARLAPRARRLVAVGMAAGVLALVAITWVAGRLTGLDRLLGSEVDQRVTFLPVTLSLLRDYAPFGSGFGTFDPVFRRVEPDALLKLTYFNHAHNDLLELAITGGLAALAAAVAYVAWLVRRGFRVFGADAREPTAPLARAGLCAALLLLLASLADYPLRTPLAAAMLALTSLWVADRRPPAKGQSAE